MNYTVELVCNPEGEILCTSPAEIGPVIQTGPSGAQANAGTPMDHLGVALGSCLLHFARTFLTRRGEATESRIRVSCTVDQKRCEIERYQADLCLDLNLTAEDRDLLSRILHQCPIHKALEFGSPVHVRIFDRNSLVPG